ncbi:hypothetical protein Pan241w_60660 [Gimesia alba]|uniref:Uncharacterized protein n=1 Tax=Gimesia alba TaxID=2527973 RepID=A0A517RPZ0_9PLAN|nr:hypothetical protein [Gimesia alba]QDT45938.1 hypothetical protein Pan241w_60660 [Gimesia alba]
MNSKRITAGVLVVLLLVLLSWTFIGGVGDLRLQVLLGFGIVLGLVYAIHGRLSEWILDLSGNKIVADDAPGNISPRVYLPILGAVVLIAVIIFLVNV